MPRFKFMIPLLLLFINVDAVDRADAQKKKSVIPERTEFTNALIDSLGENVVLNEQQSYILYYKKGSYSEQHAELLIPMINAAVDRIKEILKISKLFEGFYLVMIDSRDEMERIINWNVKALASGRNDAAIFVYNSEIRPYFKHELFHLIAFNIWGDPVSRLLDEGGAMFSDNQCLQYENPLSAINKHLYKNDMWFDLDDLVNDFNGMAGENDMIAYLQAGFIFRYLYENYGVDKMKILWKRGFSDLQDIYGFDINELAQKLEAELSHIKQQHVDWSELMDKGCG